jgi:hypothetical protein
MLAGDFKAVSTDEKAELAAEIERKRPGTPERIKEARRQAIEKNWRQNAVPRIHLETGPFPKT